ncbi:VP-1054 [Urbanus proteus nucleopolyhedrovirus]|uniref:VP-1054 n=1 Tax=Urbanus proteus nucleopolyhedrovirus TaxID=1675866 RepID=A0A162GTV1_9ABAC|nr:VP-1054 [Urbanus proteus nucleopolyhedrovirus]AKR17297.1 VP-1054 [Urbanus proteus nucleopolyhedrovirus]
MSSKKRVVVLNQCVSEKYQLLKPLILKLRNQCPIHLRRANCRAIRVRNPLTNLDFYRHVTILENTFLDYNCRPYFMCLLDETDVSRRTLNVNGDKLYAAVDFERLDSDEIFYTIDEAGEKNLIIIRNVIITLFKCFKSLDTQFILMVDFLQIDLVYSMFRCIILPQKMLCINSNETIVQNNDLFQVFSVPSTDEALISQQIYLTFLVYNTVLTMVLKQKNPFNSSKMISVILRTLGKCPNNKDRIKCCDLQYGGTAPDHIFCAPREMVKKIFHYSKWARTPNNYRRYYTLITSVPLRMRTKNYDVISNERTKAKQQLLIIDWHNFFEDFRAYFGIRV